ncbi:ABC transporter ATP-binding protein [Methylobacterium currus]|uniref:ABC transporter ATP-binding protein n=1 Tax=Methylobacterium currus TaxID=2051553 RepID=A0A2R4WFF7_9HYPH|nr:ABC transporter ATP-binding protein [Methylobacterium currus]AWB20284.1 ABC transporter ATP-binding protein [Methylobacterium currus]UHC14960.1 ABC transporter ATP-binding protein [Methylobacterium currus]
MNAVAPAPLLAVENLRAWYGHSHILQGLSLEVRAGEIVTLVGRNGAGKTTTLKSIMGLVPKREGRVTFAGADILDRPPHERFHRGLAYVPEERRIVPGLTVEENLRLGILAAKGPWAAKGDRATKGERASRHHEARRIEAIAETFPRLKQRLKQEAITMSGGEQQMLAIARALMAEPVMVLLDEPSEGIMPILVEEMFEQFVAMKRAGTTILLVEQNVELALEISDRVYIIDGGAVVYHAQAAELRRDPEIQARYCAV